MNDHYMLEGHEIVPIAVWRDGAIDSGALKRWGEMFSDVEARRVDQTYLDGGVSVSTVFLGLDHSFGEGPPLIFESMIFGGELFDDQDRCSTWEQAEAMHAAMVERARNAQVKP